MVSGANRPNSDGSDVVSTKMDIIRTNYNKLNSKTAQQRGTQKLPAGQLLIVRAQMKRIREKFNELTSESSNYEIRNVADAIIRIYDESLESHDLPLDIAEQLSEIVDSKYFKQLKIVKAKQKQKGSLEYKINQMDKSVAKKLAQAVEEEAMQSTDAEEISRLSGKITSRMEKLEPIYINAIRRKIESRRVSILQQNSLKKIKNEISPEMESMLADFANGKIDVEEVNRRIEIETQKKMKNIPQGRFALTQEQQRSIVIMQFKTLLTEKGATYPIKYPEKAITQILQIDGSRDISNGLRVVALNLATDKKYKEAQELCNKYVRKPTNMEDAEESALSKYARKLKMEIALKELGDLILDQINSQPDRATDEMFIRFLEERIESEKIDLSSIRIGENITLEDVWFTQPSIPKNR